MLLINIDNRWSQEFESLRLLFLIVDSKGALKGYLRRVSTSSKFAFGFQGKKSGQSKARAL